MTDHRDYLDEQYKIAVLDYKSAHNEDEQWSARKRMAQTERTASELYGFDFADHTYIYEQNHEKSRKKLYFI